MNVEIDKTIAVALVVGLVSAIALPMGVPFWTLVAIALITAILLVYFKKTLETILDKRRDKKQTAILILKILNRQQNKGFTIPEIVIEAEYSLLSLEEAESILAYLSSKGYVHIDVDYKTGVSIYSIQKADRGIIEGD